MTIATLENYQKGMYVIRGPNWEFDNQDTRYGGKGYGILGDRELNSRGQPTHWVEVMWNGGYQNIYCLTEEHIYIVVRKEKILRGAVQLMCLFCKAIEPIHRAIASPVPVEQ